MPSVWEGGQKSFQSLFSPFTNPPPLRLLPSGYENEKAVNLKEGLSLLNETKFICSMSSIQELFSFCMDVDCQMPLVEVKETFVGCVLEI